jgi:uncharacterized OB-fold protein
VSGIPVSVCPACGWRGFPERFWCPRCGRDDVVAEQVEAGVVTERTMVRRAAGRPSAPPVPIATVRLAGGGTAVARLESAGEAARVALSVVGGAPVARPADAREA